VTRGSAEGPIRATTVYLLRHAHAGDPFSWNGPDELRPLSSKGQKQARRLGRLLAKSGVRPDLVLSSPKVRAEQTARAVAAEFEGLKVRVDDRLAGGFGLRSLTELLASSDAVAPMLVGHDPDFSALLSLLVGARGMDMKKGALAAVDLVPPIVRGSGLLRFLLVPELFDRG
jgi:phosphohistidine phosphatase